MEVILSIFLINPFHLNREQDPPLTKKTMEFLMNTSNEDFVGHQSVDMLFPNWIPYDFCPSSNEEEASIISMEFEQNPPELHPLHCYQHLHFCMFYLFTTVFSSFETF